MLEPVFPRAVPSNFFWVSQKHLLMRW